MNSQTMAICSFVFATAPTQASMPAKPMVDTSSKANALDDPHWVGSAASVSVPSDTTSESGENAATVRAATFLR